MPLTGTAPVLALALMGCGIDPVGAPKVTSLAGALNGWITSNAVVNNLPPEGTMSTADGAVFLGQGRITFAADGNALGTALAASIPATDDEALAKWRALGRAFVDHITNFGRANPLGFTAPPPPSGGPVVGVGTLAFTSMAFNPPLAEVLGLTDTPNEVIWLALGAALLAYLVANAQIGVAPGTPNGLVSPGSGPLTLVTVIT